MTELTPDVLETLVIEGCDRAERLGWLNSEAEWEWALRRFQWSVLLESRGCPGIPIWAVGASPWQHGAPGRRLARAAVRLLRRQGLLKTKGRGRRLYAAGDDSGWQDAVDALTDWLYTRLG